MVNRVLTGMWQKSCGSTMAYSISTRSEVNPD
jgi:hypothetical protein